jgi:hypothetical protein
LRHRILLAAAAIGIGWLYRLALIGGLGLGLAIMPMPRAWLTLWPAWRVGSFTWLLTAHVISVLLASLPFAWAVGRLYGRFGPRVSVVLGVMICATLEAQYATDMISAPWLVRGMWLVDVLLFSLTLPFLVWLLRKLPSNSRWSGP